MAARFKSRRITVYLINGRVEKHFSTPPEAWRGYEKLKFLRAKGVAVPWAEPPQGRVLYLEYLTGETIPDFLEVPHSAPELRPSANKNYQKAGPNMLTCSKHNVSQQEGIRQCEYCKMAVY